MAAGHKLKVNPQRVYLLLLAGCLLGLLAGCTPRSERFEKEPATFWDDLWHGITAPWDWFTEEDNSIPRPAQTTDGYDGGVKVGTGWVIVWIVLGALIGMADSDSADDGCCLGMVGGCLLSMLVGAFIYWTGVGLILLAGTVPD